MLHRTNSGRRSGGFATRAQAAGVVLDKPAKQERSLVNDLRHPDWKRRPIIEQASAVTGFTAKGAYQQDSKRPFPPPSLGQAERTRLAARANEHG